MPTQSFTGRIVLAFAVSLLLLAIGCDDNPADSRPTGPAGRLYVLNQTDATMYVFDTETMSRIDSVATEVSRPHYIEFAPDGQKFYITTLEATGHIARFATSPLAFQASATVPPAVQPSAVAITRDGLFGYVCNFSSPSAPTRIFKFDLSTLQPVDSMQAGAITHDIKITSDGNVVIACNRNTDDVTLVYTDADTVTFVPMSDAGSSPPGQQVYGPFGVVIDHRDSLAFIACMDALQVRWLDIAARTIVDSVDIPVDTVGQFIAGPTLMAVSPDNDVVWLTTRGGNTVVVFRVSTKQILANIPVATPNPFGISMSADGSRVYVACINKPLQRGRVYVFDGGAFTKIDSVDVGRESYGLIWRPVP